MKKRISLLQEELKKMESPLYFVVNNQRNLKIIDNTGKVLKLERFMDDRITCCIRCDEVQDTPSAGFAIFVKDIVENKPYCKFSKLLDIHCMPANCVISSWTVSQVEEETFLASHPIMGVKRLTCRFPFRVVEGEQISVRQRVIKTPQGWRLDYEIA